MKKLLAIFIMGMFLLGLGCKKEEDPTGPDEKWEFVAKVDSKDFESTWAQWDYSNGSNPENYIRSQDKYSNWIYLVIEEEEVEEKTYLFEEGDDSLYHAVYIGYETGTGISHETSFGGGSLTITEKTDNSLKGTFQFTAVSNDFDTVKVTDGNFYVFKP